MNKQIEEMAKICTDKCQVCHNAECRQTTKSQYCIAETLYNADYRNQKETVSEILQKVDYESNGQTVAITNLIRKQFGIEVK